MHTRRFTRLTNGFSKKVENHAHSVALFAMYYNFVRVHKTLRITPAMAANVTKRLWEMSDIVDVLEGIRKNRRIILYALREPLDSPTVTNRRHPMDTGQHEKNRAIQPQGRRRQDDPYDQHRRC